MKNYSFLVAGHTYGKSTGKNLGFYPKFFPILKDEISSNNDGFIIFTGDIVRKSDLESWDSIMQSLNQISIPSYFVMGNHDYSDIGKNIFQAKHGNTYYSFNQSNDLFYVFDTQTRPGYLGEDQINSFKKVLSEADKINNVFIFFHELLWVKQKLKYVHINHNNRPYRFETNFWADLFPLLKIYKQKHFYIIAGDLGGMNNSIATFFDKIENITLIASGMGGAKNENFLRVNVSPERVFFELIPIDYGESIGIIQEYHTNNLLKRFWVDNDMKTIIKRYWYYMIETKKRIANFLVED